ncbi:MAG: hypothetical protein MJ252_00685, partial [archaeon]|nr:hypothetical protein [archaeon]
MAYNGTLSKLLLSLLLVLVMFQPTFTATSEQWDSVDLKAKEYSWNYVDMASFPENLEYFDFNALQEETSGDKGGAVWWTRNFKNTRGLKIMWTPEITLDGDFTDNLKYPQGYALCFSTTKSAPDSVPLGKKGSGLGYDGLNQAVCIEFDFIQNKERNDVKDPHISIHYNLDGKISAISPTTKKEQEYVNKKMPNYYDPEGGDYFAKMQMVVEIVGKTVQIYDVQPGSKTSSQTIIINDFAPFMDIFEKDDVYFGITAALNRKKSIRLKKLEILTISESNSVVLSIPGSTSGKIIAGDKAQFLITLQSSIGTVLKVFPQEYEDIVFEIEGKTQSGITYSYDETQGLIASIKGLNTAGYYTAVAKVVGRNTNTISFNIVAGGGNHLDICEGGRYDEDFYITEGVTQSLESFSFIVCSYDHYRNQKALDVAYLTAVTASYPQNFAPETGIKIEKYESSDYQFKVTVPITSTGTYRLFSEYFEENLYRYYKINTNISPENSKVFFEGLTNKFKKGSKVSLRINLKDQLGLEINSDIIAENKCSFMNSQVIDPQGHAQIVTENIQSNYVLLEFTGDTSGKFTFAPKFKCGTDDVKEFICPDCTFYYVDESSSSDSFLVYSDFQEKNLLVDATALKTPTLYISLEENSFKITTIYPADTSGYQTVWKTEPANLKAILTKDSTTNTTLSVKYNKYGFIDIFYSGSERKVFFDQFTKYTLTITIGTSTLTLNLKCLFKDDFMNNVKVNTGTSTKYVAFFKKPSFEFEVGDNLYLFDLYGRDSAGVLTNGNDLNCANVNITIIREGKEEATQVKCQKLSHYLAVSAFLMTAGEQTIKIKYKGSSATVDVASVDCNILPGRTPVEFEYESLNAKGSYTLPKEGLGITSVATDVSEIPRLTIAFKDKYGNIIRDARKIFDQIPKVYSDESLTHKQIHVRLEENGLITIYDDSHTLSSTSVKFTLPQQEVPPVPFVVTLKKKSEKIDPSNSYCYLESLQPIRLQPRMTEPQRGIFRAILSVVARDYYGNVVDADDNFSMTVVKSDNSLQAVANADTWESIIKKAGEYRLKCFYGNTPIEAQGEYIDASLTVDQAETDNPDFQRIWLLDYHDKTEVMGYAEDALVKVPAIIKRSQSFNIKMEHVDEFGNLLYLIQEEYTPMLYQNGTQFQPLQIAGADSESRDETRYFFKLEPDDFAKCSNAIYYTMFNNVYYYFKFINDADDEYDTALPVAKASLIYMGFAKNVTGTVDKPAQFRIDLRTEDFKRISNLSLKKLKIECTDCKTVTMEYNATFVQKGVINVMVVTSAPGQWSIKITYDETITFEGYKIFILPGTFNKFSAETAVDQYFQGTYVYVSTKDRNGNNCGVNTLDYKEYINQLYKIKDEDGNWVFTENYYNPINGMIIIKIDPRITGKVEIHGEKGLEQSVNIAPTFRKPEHLFTSVSVSGSTAKVTMQGVNDFRKKVTLTGVDTTLIAITVLHTEGDVMSYLTEIKVGSDLTASYNLPKSGDYIFYPTYSGMPLPCEKCKISYTVSGTQTIDKTKTKVYFKEGAETWLQKGEGMSRAFFKYTFPVFKIQFISTLGNIVKPSSSYTYKLGDITMSAYIAQSGEVYAYLSSEGRQTYQNLGNFQELVLNITSGSSIVANYTGFFMLNAYIDDEISSDTCAIDSVPSIINKNKLYLLRAGSEIQMEFKLSGCLPQTQQFFDSADFQWDSKIDTRVIPSDTYGNYLLFVKGTTAGTFESKFKFKKSADESFSTMIYPSSKISRYDFGSEVEYDGNYAYLTFGIKDEFGNKYDNPGLHELLYEGIPIGVTPISDYYPHVKVAYQGEKADFPYYLEIERTKGGFQVDDPYSGNSRKIDPEKTTEFLKLLTYSYITVTINEGTVNGTLTLIDDYQNPITEYNDLGEYLSFYYATYDSIANYKFKSNQLEGINITSLSFEFDLPEGLPVYDSINIIPYFHGFQMKCIGCSQISTEPVAYNLFDGKYFRISAKDTLYIEHALRYPIICSTEAITKNVPLYIFDSFSIGALNCLGTILATSCEQSFQETSGSLKFGDISANIRVRPDGKSETGMISNVAVQFLQKTFCFIQGDVAELWIDIRNVVNNNLFYTNKIDYSPYEALDFNLLVQTAAKGGYILVLPTSSIPSINNIKFFVTEERPSSLYLCGQSKVPASFSLKNQKKESVNVMTYEVETVACSEKMNLYMEYDTHQRHKTINFHTNSNGVCVLTLEFLGTSYLMCTKDEKMRVKLDNHGTKKNIFNSYIRITDTGVLTPSAPFNLKLGIFDNYGVDISSSVLENLTLQIYEYNNPAINKLVYKTKNYFSNIIAATYDQLGMEVGKRYIITASMNNTIFKGVYSTYNQYLSSSTDIDNLNAVATYGSAGTTEDVSKYVVTNETILQTVTLQMDFPLSLTVSFSNYDGFTVPACSTMAVKLFISAADKDKGEAIMEFTAVMKDDYDYTVFVEKTKLNQFLHLPTRAYMLQFAYPYNGETTYRYLQFKKNGLLHDPNLQNAEYQFVNIVPVTGFKMTYEAGGSVLTYAKQLTKSTFCLIDSNQKVYNEHLDLSTFKVDFLDTSYGCESSYSQTYRGCVDIFLMCQKAQTSSEETVKANVTYKTNIVAGDTLNVKINPEVPSEPKATVIDKWPTTSLADRPISCKFTMEGIVQLTEDQFKVAINGAEIARNLYSVNVYQKEVTLTINAGPLSYTPKPVEIKVYFKHGYDEFSPLNDLNGSVKLTQEEIAKKTIVAPSGFRAGEDLDIWLILRDAKGFCFEGAINISDYNITIEGLPSTKNETKQTFQFEIKNVSNIDKCGRILHMIYKGDKITKSGKYKLSHDYQGDTTLNVYAGTLDAKNAKIERDPQGDDEIGAGQTFLLKISGKDTYNNSINLYELQDQFDMKIYDKNDPTLNVNYTQLKYVQEGTSGTDMVVFELIVYTTGSLSIDYYYNGEVFNPFTKVSSVKIVAGNCTYSDDESNVVINPLQGLLPGEDLNIQITCKDKFGNLVSTGTYTKFIISFTRTEGEITDSFDREATYDKTANNFKLVEKLSYEGEYKLQIRLNSEPLLYGYKSGKVITVEGLYCSDETKPYKCPSGICVSKKGECDAYYYDESKKDLCKQEDRENGKFYNFGGKCYAVDEIPLELWNENY